MIGGAVVQGERPRLVTSIRFKRSVKLGTREWESITPADQIKVERVGDSFALSAVHPVLKCRNDMTEGHLCTASCKGQRVVSYTMVHVTNVAWWQVPVDPPAEVDPGPQKPHQESSVPKTVESKPVPKTNKPGSTKSAK